MVIRPLRLHNRSPGARGARPPHLPASLRGRTWRRKTSASSHGGESPRATCAVSIAVQEATVVSPTSRPSTRTPVADGASWSSDSFVQLGDNGIARSRTAIPGDQEATAQRRLLWRDGHRRLALRHGSSARLAQLPARGDLKIGDDFVHESIIGSLFCGRVEKATTVGEYTPYPVWGHWITGQTRPSIARDRFEKGVSLL